MRLNFFCYLFLLLNTVAFSQLKKKVLFIGNSYTYVNNLPQLITDIALSKSDTLVFDQSTPGGFTFQNHCSSAVTWSKIRSQKWDAVILQAQSQEPSFNPLQVASQTYPFAKQLVDSIKANSACAEVIFYMTWGRKNGDASNCMSYTPVCTYNGMQARLRQSYILFKDSFKTSVAPVGVAWKKVRQALPAVDLYQVDESHPSLEGSYLAACVFYSSIFQKTAIGSTYYSTVTPTLAASLQSYGSHTVLDSTLTWSTGSNLPLANFSYSLISGTTIQFNNQSLNGISYNWSFGSSLQSPIYTFTNSGNYVVQLKTTNNCKSDSITKNIVVTSLRTKEKELTPLIYFHQNNLTINNLNTSETLISIYTVEGKLAKEFKMAAETNSSFYVADLPKGLYLVKTTSRSYINTTKIIISD
ncbi:MAG: T9SS type A sorting domain-containing protein [Bacteroidota bacterium]|nr:T9SS type A sorting domain-containing protein [Bacteroidota bacterium]